MSEFLNGLSNQTWFITIVSFLAANLGTILTMAILILKNKIKEDKLKRQFKELMASTNIEVNQEFQDKIDALTDNISKQLNAQLDLVSEKLKLDSEQRKEAVAQKSIEVKELIDEITAKTTATLDKLATPETEVEVNV